MWAMLLITTENIESSLRKCISNAITVEVYEAEMGFCAYGAFYKKIFQSFYFKMSRLIQCVAFRFFVIICEIYKQILQQSFPVFKNPNLKNNYLIS